MAADSGPRCSQQQPTELPWSSCTSGLSGERSPTEREATSEKGPGAEEQQKGHSPQSLPPFPLQPSARILPRHLHKGVRSSWEAHLPVVMGPVWPPPGLQERVPRLQLQVDQ